MLYIMRHGKTEWNSLHKLQGRTDIPLNDEGRLMALNACREYRDLNSIVGIVNRGGKIHVQSRAL